VGVAEWHAQLYSR